MNFTDYRALPAINFSRIKHMRDCPLAYRRALDDGDTDTDDRALLRYQHALVLEPHTIADAFAIWQGVEDDKGKMQTSANSNAYKAWAAEQRAAGRAILKASTDAQVAAILRADTIATIARSHPVVSAALATGQTEVVFMGHDAELGRDIKCRTDIYSADCVLDMKDYGSTEPRHVGRMAWSMGAVHQLSFNRRCMVAANAPLPSRWGLLCIDGKLGDACIRWIDPNDLDLADVEIREWFATLAECEVSGEWPGRGDGPLDLPSYAFAPDIEDFNFAEDLT